MTQAHQPFDGITYVPETAEEYTLAWEGVLEGVNDHPLDILAAIRQDLDTTRSVVSDNESKSDTPAQDRLKKMEELRKNFAGGPDKRKHVE
jgi:hypothetical protein